MRWPKITSIPVLALFIISAIWLALVIAAPYLVPSGTLQDLSGVVGGHENEAKFSNLGAVPHAVYWLGDAECHQLANRSYFLNDNQMPFCARDVGLFIGIAAGFGLASFYRYKIRPLYVLLGLIPIAIDGGLQALTSYESNNLVRILTGFLAGFVLSLIIAHFIFALQEDSAKAKAKKSAKPKQD